MSAQTLRILQIAHNHPLFPAGGTEAVAMSLHRQALAEGLDSWFLGALDKDLAVPHPGTHMMALSDDQREAALFTDSFDYFMLAQPDHFGFLREFGDYLEALQPDVVHFHHVINFGLEALFAARRRLPSARIVLTLHDYYLICANNGQLFKHHDQTRCDGPSLIQCRKCLPSISPERLKLRQIDVAAALSVCDALVSPSMFLKDKIEGVLDLAQPVTFIENGYLGSADVLDAPEAKGGTTVFGYFGNVSAIKGLDHLLEALAMLKAAGVTGFRLHVHGSQLYKDPDFQARLDAALAEIKGDVRFFGAYRPEDLPMLMADVDCVVFPSIWWENAPLVVYEAMHHAREIIAYPHGGAAEILARHQAGRLARRSDVASLAAALRAFLDRGTEAVSVARRQLPGPADLLNAHLALYRDASTENRLSTAAL
ncbi:glycosyltransferase [Rhizobium sp. TRM95796]|uniref:glycosyltransferase n=1 Tax=Rhizobium sp. TRM95796 TaxID=2979862 RepID=UPI0021E930DD|nr:glycosyltransferase [Rhizobium sp. TRM95796]MCV3767533.1 glycosyltransferase [Rhizobium sp. TRM95796]